jgi:hypothetical protein
MFFIATTVYCVVKMLRVIIDDLMKWYQEHYRSIDQKVCYPCPQTANHPSSSSVIYSSETSDWPTLSYYRNIKVYLLDMGNSTNNLHMHFNK